MTKAPNNGRKTGLPGRYFITRDEAGSTTRQGAVHCIIPSSLGDLVLVQYFEPISGQPHTMALVRLADMIEKPAPPDYIFFEDVEFRRFYMECYQRPLDDRIDKRREREREQPKSI